MQYSAVVTNLLFWSSLFLLPPVLITPSPQFPLYPPPLSAPYSQHRGSDQTSSGYPTIQSGDSKMSIASEDIFNRPASRQFMNPLFSMDNEEDDNIGYDAAEDFDYIANEKALEAAAED